MAAWVGAVIRRVPAGAHTRHAANVFDRHCMLSDPRLSRNTFSVDHEEYLREGLYVTFCNSVI